MKIIEIFLHHNKKKKTYKYTQEPTKVYTRTYHNIYGGISSRTHIHTVKWLKRNQPSGSFIIRIRRNRIRADVIRNLISPVFHSQKIERPNTSKSGSVRSYDKSIEKLANIYKTTSYIQCRVSLKYSRSYIFFIKKNTC